MSTQHEPISNDLIWEVTRNNNSFLVKRKQAGGVQFSRDPYNLTNKHARKYEGYCNDQAISIQPDSNTVAITTKLPKRWNQPAKSTHTTSFNASTPTRKLYKSVVNSTAKKGYRPDLRAETVARASAVRQSQRENKKEREAKLRGRKARKNQADKEASS
ncbi:60S ribosomal L28e [Lecanosticta acicola]|uniref:60S ribosomal L28e n=1 Tax=Lecanosticta acicola TaxID=111012 RepID=A0AAI8YZ81_9PEZI|nr:60S ribosomal L28e [Lecanosticta acicola]